MAGPGTECIPGHALLTQVSHRTEAGQRVCTGLRCSRYRDIQRQTEAQRHDTDSDSDTDSDTDTESHRQRQRVHFWRGTELAYGVLDCETSGTELA
eukprot:3833330-Rhodomonas_salina.1